MKKLAYVTLALLFAALTLLSGCSSAPAVPAQQADIPAEQTTENLPDTPSDVPAEPVDAPEEEPQVQQAGRLGAIYDTMLASGVLPEMMSVNEALVTDFYGILPEQYTEAVFYISYDSLLADEVVLISAADEPAADEIQALLTSRLNTKAEEADGYSPEQAAIIKACSVSRNGLELALVVSPEAQSLLDIYLAALNG